MKFSFIRDNKREYHVIGYQEDGAHQDKDSQKAVRKATSNRGRTTTIMFCAMLETSSKIIELPKPNGQLSVTTNSLFGFEKEKLYPVTTEPSTRRCKIHS